MVLTVFLDRDGVVNRYRRPTVLRWKDFEFLPGSLEALRMLDRDDVQVFVVTNKAWIGLKILPEKRSEEIHDRMLRKVEAAGGRIDDIYTCPHTPVARCPCRKPRPGMLEQAAADHDVDRDRSWIVGDNVTDHQAGRAFGCRTVLLRTTHGEKIEAKAKRAGETPDLFADRLDEAVEAILQQDGSA